MYQDSLGVPTIGYGHNLRDRPISRRAAEVILDDDMADVAVELRRALPWAERLSEARYGVLLNMAFNLGVAGLLAFRKALAAMEQGDWMIAAAEMLDSKWAEQVGPRAYRLARQMREDVWA